MPPTDQFMLGEMNAKLDTLVRRSEEDRKFYADALKTLAKRVDELEAFRWKVLGAACALGTVGGLLVKFLLH